MSSKLSIISAAWDAWLDRYSPPANLKANDVARLAETDAHVAILARYTPSDGLSEWVARVTAALDRSMQTRAWPTIKEIEAACMAIRREDADAAPPSPQADARQSIDPFQVAAKRIQEGHPVGDGYLWGRDAVILLRRGLVTQAQIKHRRDAHIAGMAEVWDADRIAEHVADLDARHAEGVKLEDGARRVWRENRAQAERRAEEAKALIGARRIPHHQPDPGRMQEAEF